MLSDLIVVAVVFVVVVVVVNSVREKVLMTRGVGGKQRLNQDAPVSNL